MPLEFPIKDVIEDGEVERIDSDGAFALLIEEADPLIFMAFPDEVELWRSRRIKI